MHSMCVYSKLSDWLSGVQAVMKPLEADLRALLHPNTAKNLKARSLCLLMRAHAHVHARACVCACVHRTIGCCQAKRLKASV